eukprot:gnl/MRDRNA2_/MRDRNA2_28539_c0_seq1.p1 gnl/MRDRNA2_/MRDRNA2_28539_c0~~gnl/MRDRNA2_/MRDRNA2_28539_c0_seq1.p1  ORF type:complete len:596 (+),score=114.61 gnl/MRDRNA2_/MRDRNA2_28539_c0_seq1:78-1790(+)
MAQSLVFLFLCVSTLGAGRSFIPRPHVVEFHMDLQKVQQELHEALHGALGHGHGVDSKQISVANATLLPIFSSLPKNDNGRVGAPGMRYAVQRYFSKNHGWVIKGFESHGASTVQQLQSGGILGSKVPGYVEAILEDKFQKGGFALHDILTVVIVVERLIFDEVIRSVEAAYHLNHLATKDMLKRDSLLTVLESHMIEEMMERTDFDAELHKQDREEIHELYTNWEGLQDFIKDVVTAESTVLRSGSQNPFCGSGAEVFSFDDAVRIAQRISNEYGRWGNQECMELKSFISEADTRNTGRVPLSAFYNLPTDKWSFHETPEYLRELGALDDSSKALGPQVIVTNYVYGMSNCLSSTPYYSVCCLNECEGLLQQIEVHIGKPSATPEEILTAVRSLKMTNSLLPQTTDDFLLKLTEIASRSNGKVPLHGRLFAQWLHYVFPLQCPYPHAAGSVRPQTQGARLSDDKSIMIDDEERSQHVKSMNHGTDVALSEAGEELWSWDEELLHAPHHDELAGTNHRAPLAPVASRLLPGLIAAILLFSVKQLHTSVSEATKQRMLLPMTMKLTKSHDL